MSNKMIYTVTHIRRHRLKLLAAAVIIFCVVILKTELSPDLYFLHLRFENVSCYQEHGDELPFATNRGFHPPANSIFFHESSCRGGLNSRQACAVEAAARAHRQWDIHVLFLAPVRSLDTKSFRALKKYDRIKFARINLHDYAKQTPLESLVANGALNRTKWRVSHTSDVLRYLTMYKWGGIYLDLDTIVVKPLGVLSKNWSARESDMAVAAGAMSFSRDSVGRMFAEAAIRDLARNFRGDIWGHNGPGVITRVLKEKCGTKDVVSMHADVCQGFEVYPPELFYPIGWDKPNLYFEPGQINTFNNKPYVFHVWNFLTQNTKMKEDSFYATLAKTYCPSVYDAYGNAFGS